MFDRTSAPTPSLLRLKPEVETEPNLFSSTQKIKWNMLKCSHKIKELEASKLHSSSKLLELNFEVRALYNMPIEHAAFITGMRN